MATNYYYIATPFADLDQPCWRLVEAEVGGAEAIVFALRLRGLAAQASFGGLVALHDGTPMQAAQICSVLGYTPQRVQRSLEILHRHHLAEAVEGGGIRLLDPLLLQHLRALEVPKGPKSGALRSKEYRDRKILKANDEKTKDVTRNVTKLRDVSSDAARDGAVAQQPQNADISCKSPSHETSQNSSNKKIEYTTTTTAVVVKPNEDLLQKAKLILSAWLPAVAAVDAVAAALAANHPPEFIVAQIAYSRQNAKSNPCAYLQAALQGDFAGFYAAAEAKAAAVAAKQARATAEAAALAKEDSLLPPVSATECFSIFEKLELQNVQQQG